MVDEYSIELWVEHQMDRIDKQYMNGKITTEEYQAKLQEVSVQASKMYDNINLQETNRDLV